MRLSSSVSRVARRSNLVCVSSSLSSSHAHYIGASRPLPQGPRQRRYSSSKTSSPPKDDSRPITSPAEAGAKDAGSGSRKRPTTRIARQKTKEVSTKGTETIGGTGVSQLPSVPSTNHLHPHEIHVASFFSLHRPISVTAVIPPPTLPSTFSSIFAPKVVQKTRPADVIYTLSVAVDTLEKASTGSETSQVPSQQQNEPLTHETLRAAVTQASQTNAEPTNLDRHSQATYINIEELARNFRPFRPPPPPIPISSETSSTSFSQPRPHTIRIRLRGHTNFFTARIPLHRDPAYLSGQNYVEPRNTGKQPFLERMRIRQESWEERRAGRIREVWRAISVKRQRKLKMKKHKYKKLMRRTRNLRRKLDRL